ncbi:MAG TPA: serine hydrolase domain-containing protein [Vicinamibacteria bacterium]
MKSPLAVGVSCCATSFVLTTGAWADDAHPTPRFSRADRRETLAAAFPEIERYLAGRMALDHLPGLAFGVVIDGELAHGKGLGVRDVAANAPATLDTAFRIASMTKSFTALAILKLRDEGRLSLEDPVAKHVKELARLTYPTRDSAPLTIRQLLTHSEGFPEDNPWGDRQLAIGDETFSRWLTAGIPFSTAPGTAFEYSNYGFAILGQVVSRASGLRYRDYVEQGILRPLGMTSTKWEAASVPADHLAKGYQWRDGAWTEEPALADGAFGAMGGLITTGHDLARYVAFLLSAWPPRDDPDSGPVRRSSVREMQQSGRFEGLSATRATPDGPTRVTATNYGFGIGFSEECDTRLIIAHSGGLPGFGSIMRMLPEHGVGVLVMANRTYAPVGGMARQALEILRGTGALVPRALPASATLLSTREQLARLLDHWDDGAARALAADNFLLDRPLSERRDEMARLRERHGHCRAGAVEPENWLRGRFRADCDRGWIDVDFTLAPTQPPRLQYLRLTPGLPASDAMASAATTLATLASAWTDSAAASLAGAALDRPRLQAQLHAIGDRYGACRVGPALDGDGARSARIRFGCDRGSLDVSLQLDEAGRLSAASFAPPPETRCVP